MAIVDWKEAKEHATLTALRGGKREWTAPYILTVDDPRDDAKACVDFMDTIGRGLSSSFRYGDREDAFSFCKQITPTRMPGSALHWQVICQSSTLDPKDNSDKEDEDSQPAENPVDWRYEISSGTQFFQVPVWKAWNMDPMPVGGAGAGYQRTVNSLGPVHNSAGVVYDPPLTCEVPETVVRLSGNAFEFWAAILTVNAGTINQFAVAWSDRLCEKYGFHAQSFAAHCVLCASATADYRVENGYRFWRYTFEFRLRTPADATNPQDGFLESVLDRGLTRIANPGAPDGRGGTYSSGDFKAGMAEAAAVRDIEDRRVPEMVLLDGHGQPLRGSEHDDLRC